MLLLEEPVIINFSFYVMGYLSLLNGGLATKGGFRFPKTQVCITGEGSHKIKKISEKKCHTLAALFSTIVNF